MKRHSLKLALLCSALLGAALAAPASAQTVNLTQQCARLVDNTGTQIIIENGGFVPRILCHGRGDFGICGEAFTACVNNTFALGGGFSGTNPPTPAAVYNLLPSASGGPFHLCEPFFIPSPGAKPVFLTPVPLSNPPTYDLDAQDLDGDGMFDDSVPLGTVINVILDTPPDPASSNCIGVRTTIQHMVGTCKIWKVRKFYNTCKSNKTLTQIKEFELPCDLGTFAAKAGPGQYLTAVASTFFGHEFITLQSMGNNGSNAGNAKNPPYQQSKAGSVPWTNNDADFAFLPPTPFNTEFLACMLTSGFTTARRNDGYRWLEVFLSYFPGGVVLKPVAKPGSEKLVTFCLDIQ